MNDETIEALGNFRKMKEEERETAIAMKMARELAAVRKKKKKKKDDEEVEHLQRRRSEIKNLLQRCGTSINALHSLSIKESRHEENCHAIPEGNENEKEYVKDDNDNDDDNNSLLKSLSTTSTDFGTNSKGTGTTDSNCDSGRERKGSVKQREQQER